MLTLKKLYNELKKMIEQGVDPNTEILIDLDNDVGKYYCLGQFRVRESANNIALTSGEIVISD